MADHLTHILLWLFIINVGTAFGAGVYEAKIVIPQWSSATAGPHFHWDAEAALRTNPGPRFWAFVTTVPLTFLTGASLVFAWFLQSPRRELWLGAAAAVFVERIATFAYFIPTMVRLQHGSVRAGTVESTLSRWISLNHVRNGVYLAAWITALQALTFVR
jgi:hypothetical protein